MRIILRLIALVLGICSITIAVYGKYYHPSGAFVWDHWEAISMALFATALIALLKSDGP